MIGRARVLLLTVACVPLVGCAQLVRQHYYSPTAEGAVGERNPPRYYSDLGTPLPNEVLIRTDSASLRVSVRDFGDFTIAAGLILPILPFFPLALLTPLVDPISPEPVCEVPWHGRLPMTANRLRGTERLTVQIRLEAARPLTVDFLDAARRAPGSGSSLGPEWVWIYDTRRDPGSWTSVIHGPEECDPRYPREALPLKLAGGQSQTISSLYRVPLDSSGSFEIRLPSIESEGSRLSLPSVRFELTAAWSYEAPHL